MVVLGGLEFPMSEVPLYSSNNHRTCLAPTLAQGNLAYKKQDRLYLATGRALRGRHADGRVYTACAPRLITLRILELRAVPIST